MISKCSGHLKAEIEQLNPHLVITQGGHPRKTVLGLFHSTPVKTFSGRAGKAEVMLADDFVILSITTSGLPRHTFPETLLRHFVFSGHLPLLSFFAKSQKTASCSNLTVSACGRTSHLFGRYFNHDSPVQTPSLIEGGGLPTQALGAYLAPQDDPGSPA